MVCESDSQPPADGADTRVHDDDVDGTRRKEAPGGLENEGAFENSLRAHVMAEINDLALRRP